MSAIQTETLSFRSKILVVEDDQFARLALCKVLKDMNYETIEAGDGDEGLARFKEEHPDMTFADILLPGRDGLSLITGMLAIDPEAVIIAMSSGGASKNTDFLEWAAKLGATKTISKPFKPDDIRQLLNSI